MLDGVALVAIGRNEGERLRRCLDSVLGQVGHVVYVDSGSTDGSVDMARSKGVSVVELDMRQPFTAARARNAGFRRVLELMPQVRWVQFVDGDCEVVAGWLERANAFLASNPQVAAVNGRRNERYPERSIYNRLCDMDWNGPPGPAKYCGGDVMMRSAALQQVGGYRDDLIAGEEPELCVRLRAAGWKIHALDAPMTLHDAAITRFGQWWKRSVRTGYGYAQGAEIHGAPPERHMVQQTRSLWIWGLFIPAAIVASGVLIGPWAWVLGLIFPLQVLRVARQSEGSLSERLLRGLFIVAAKLPEFQGALRYRRVRRSARAGTLIEYK